VLTAASAALLALGARQRRRRLAFVLVSHTGIQLIAIACLSIRGLAGWTIYAIGDGLVKAALFAGVALLGSGSQGDEEGEKGPPVVAIALLVAGALALAGLPPFATAIGKGVIEDATRAAGYVWVIPLLVVVSALTGAAVLLIALAALDERGASAPLVGKVAGVSVALLGASMAAGLALTSWALPAATRFVHPTGTAPSAGSVGLTTGGFLLDLLAVAGALAVALAWRRSTRHHGATARAVLWRLHSGSIGDSAAWVTVGAAGVGVVLALSLH
jgi:multicomponent Na+:H+ antiporter subunit D